MSTRKRFTDPIDVQIYKARIHLEIGRECLAEGNPLPALFRIAQAIVNLRRVEDKLNGSLCDSD